MSSKPLHELVDELERPSRHRAHASNERLAALSRKATELLTKRWILKRAPHADARR
jgi:hypothetical protein